MKSPTPTGHEALPSGCPQQLTTQLSRRHPNAQRCPAEPNARTTDHQLPPVSDRTEHTAQASMAHQESARAHLRRLCVRFPLVKYSAGRTLFRQGDEADAIFYIGYGRLHRTIMTERGNERLLGILGSGDFCGEECLGHMRIRTTSAVVVEDAGIARIDKGVMAHLLREWPELMDAFTAFLLEHSLEIEAALIDQLVGPAEQRLRRVLLRLAGVGKDGRKTGTISNVKQEMLASLIGTTRQRVNYFLNKFRRMGLIDYGVGFSPGAIQVHCSLQREGLSDARDDEDQPR